jgi:hypothetical protein
MKKFISKSVLVLSLCTSIGFVNITKIHGMEGKNQEDSLLSKFSLKYINSSTIQNTIDIIMLHFAKNDPFKLKEKYIDFAEFNDSEDVKKIIGIMDQNKKFVCNVLFLIIKRKNITRKKDLGALNYESEYIPTNDEYIPLYNKEYKKGHGIGDDAFFAVRKAEQEVKDSFGINTSGFKNVLSLNVLKSLLDISLKENIGDNYKNILELYLE